MTKSVFSFHFMKPIALLLLSGGLTAGVLLSNLCFQDYIRTVGTVGSGFLKRYPSLSINRAELLWYLLRLRLGIVLVLLVLGAYPWGAVAALGYCVWIGFSGGTVMAMAVITGGIRELLYVLAMQLPQALVYLPAWCLLYRMIIRRNDRTPGGGMPIRRYRILGGIVVGLFLAGVLFEAYVNPGLVSRLSSSL